MINKVQVGKLISNDYILTFINKMLSIVMGIVASIFLNRYMGPEMKGTYAYITNFLSLSGTILNLGIFQSYPYFKRKNELELRERYLNIYFFQFAVYTILSVVGFLFINDHGYAMGCLLLPLSVLTQQISFLVLVEDIKFRNMISIINSCINVVMTGILFFTFPRNIIFVLGVLVIKNLILVLPFLFRIKKVFNPLKCDFNFLISVLKFGFLPMLSAFLMIANYNIDIIILKQMVPMVKVGLYSMGVNLAEYAWIVPDIFKEVLFSRTARTDSIESIKKALRISSTFSLVIIAMVVIFGKQMISILYGVDFVPAYQVTVCIFFGIPSMMFFKIISTLYIAQGKKKFYFIVLLFSVITNVVLNFLLIPLYGIIGAAFASVASYSICGWIFLANFLENYNCKIKDVLMIKKADILLVKELYKK